MDDDLDKLRKKQAAILKRKQELEKNLASARQQAADLQEEALMAVPQHLLEQVQGGTTQDFKNVLAAMQNENLEKIEAFVSSIPNNKGQDDE